MQPEQHTNCEHATWHRTEQVGLNTAVLCTTVSGVTCADSSELIDGLLGLQSAVQTTLGLFSVYYVACTSTSRHYANQAPEKSEAVTSSWFGKGEPQTIQIIVCFMSLGGGEKYFNSENK